ncbi:MAG: hypothetical protein ACOC1X_04020, partial [Promethearchaeota archaeon]
NMEDKDKVAKVKEAVKSKLDLAGKKKNENTDKKSKRIILEAKEWGSKLRKAGVEEENIKKASDIINKLQNQEATLKEMDWLEKNIVPYLGPLRRKGAELLISAARGAIKGQKDQIIQRSLEMSGYSYGFFDLIKILFYKFTNTRLFPQTYKQLTCTEAIARVYDGLGIKLVDKEDYDLIFPEDIEKSDKLISV